MLCLFIYWSKLPEDLQVEILCCLPYKQIIRLKCVSKSWYFFISNQCAPRISSTTFYGLIFTCENRVTSQASLRFSADVGYHPIRKCRPKLVYGLDSFLPFRHEPKDFQDCCNGLVLLARFNSSSIPTQYCVYNPTTYECISVPLNPNHVNEKTIYVASLLFDPSKADSHSPNSFMIAVPRKSSHNALKFDVFSSILGNWSSHIISLDPVLDGFKLINRIVYVNGILYMLSIAKYLVSICLAQQKTNIKVVSSRAIELPGKDEFDCCGSIGVSKGSLVYSNSNYIKILIWVLQEDNTQWVLQHTISVDELVEDPMFRSQNVIELINVYAFHPYTEEIYLATQEKVHKYNPRTKKLARCVQLGTTQKIVCGQYKVYPLTLCAVTLNSVIKNNMNN